MSKFLHGVEVIEAQSGTRPIKTVKSSVIGLIGTAPFADETAFPLNTPVLVAGRRADAAGLVDRSNKDYQTMYNKILEEREISAKRPAALDTALEVYNRENNATLTELPQKQKEEVEAALKEAAQRAIPDIDFKDKGTLVRDIDGIFDQVGAAVVVIRVATADSQTLIGGHDGAKATGIQAFLGAESVVGVAPRILVAPGFTSDPALVTEMDTVARRLRAVIIADAAADEVSSSNANAQNYRKNFGSRRVFVVDPLVSVLRDDKVTYEPSSARVAGLIARSDSERGFWWSPSNMNMNGIVGTSRPIDFQLGDANASANLLNEKEVSTIIRQNGFKLWGNRTCSDDPKWAFLSVVRTADMINDSLLRAHMWAVDRNITTTYIEDVTNSVQSYLDSLKAQGAILGGTIWADEELNSKENIQAGKVFFNFDFTPPTPAEHIVFKSILTNNYLEEIV